MNGYIECTDAELVENNSENRTGADFRAMRERIGWSQNEVGKAMGIDPNTVKKWENPLTGWDVRPYGWSWIDRMYNAFINETESLIDYVIDEIEKQGIQKGDTIAFSYYRNGQAKYSGVRTRHGEPAGAANAVSRTVGDYFETEGYKIRYVWAEEGGWII